MDFNGTAVCEGMTVALAEPLANPKPHVMSLYMYRLGTNYGQGPINGHVSYFCINCDFTD